MKENNLHVPLLSNTQLDVFLKFITFLCYKAYVKFDDIYDFFE